MTIEHNDNAAANSPDNAPVLGRASAADAAPAPPMPDPSAREGSAFGSAEPNGAAPSGAQAAVPKRRLRGNGWKVAIVAIVAVAVVAVFGISSCTSAVSRLGGSALLGGSGTQTASDPNTIAIITLDGTIGYDGSSCSPEGLKDLLDQAEDDANVTAVVLRVNSGGGTSTAGEEMANLVKDFSKPVVVSAASIDASAAYEISSQADYLFTAKSSEVGAIGTAMQVTNYKGLMDMLGIDVDDIVSAESKDSSYGTRALTKKERAYYQRMVNQINEQFISAVAEGRKMSKKDVRKLATGLPFTGVDAVKNGLFDEIGTMEDACKKAAELAGQGSDYDTMDLTTSGNLSDLSDLLGSEESSDDGSVSKADLKKALKELTADGIK